MLVTLSPSKTLDLATPHPWCRATQPAFLKEAERLAAALRAMKASELARLMKLSDRLAAETHAQYAAWSKPPASAHARPALLLFAGDVYDGLDARTLSAAALTDAQRRLRILSGLYGVLRPNDLVRPYRLEMGASFGVDGARSLYAFWGDRIARHLRDAMRRAKTGVLINLASQEYAKAVDRSALGAERIITPEFREERDGTLRMISFDSKRARGTFARWVLEEPIVDPEELREFHELGYRYRVKGSTPDTPLFVRKRRAGAV